MSALPSSWWPIGQANTKDFASDQCRGDAARGLQHRCKCKIEIVLQHLREQRSRTRLDKPNLDPRVKGVKSAQEPRQVEERTKTLHRPNGKLASAQPFDGLDCLTRIPRHGKNALRFFIEHLTGCRQLDMTRRAHKQFGFHLMLKRTDRGRQSGLDDVHAPRRAREMLLVGHRQKVFELTKFHWVWPMPINSALFQHKLI